MKQENIVNLVPVVFIRVRCNDLHTLSTDMKGLHYTRACNRDIPTTSQVLGRDKTGYKETKSYSD